MHDVNLCLVGLEQLTSCTFEKTMAGASKTQAGWIMAWWTPPKNPVRSVSFSHFESKKPKNPPGFFEIHSLAFFLPSSTHGGYLTWCISHHITSYHIISPYDLTVRQYADMMEPNPLGSSWTFCAAWAVAAALAERRMPKPKMSQRRGAGRVGWAAQTHKRIQFLCKCIYIIDINLTSIWYIIIYTCQIYVKYVSNMCQTSMPKTRVKLDDPEAAMSAMCQWWKKGASLQVVGKPDGGSLSHGIPYLLSSKNVPGKGMAWHGMTWFFEMWRNTFLLVWKVSGHHLDTTYEPHDRYMIYDIWYDICMLYI